jgi:hypothetical protein
MDSELSHLPQTAPTESLPLGKSKETREAREQQQSRSSASHRLFVRL